MKIVICAFIIVFIIVLVGAFICFPVEDFTYIEGYWTVIPEYATAAGLKSQMLFIGPGEKNKYTAHLICDEYVDETFEFKIKPNRRNVWVIGPSEVKAIVDSKSDSPALPEKITIEIDIYEGTLRIYDDEKIYGAFYKDHEITAMYN